MIVALVNPAAAIAMAMAPPMPASGMTTCTASGYDCAAYDGTGDDSCGNPAAMTIPVTGIGWPKRGQYKKC